MKNFLLAAIVALVTMFSSNAAAQVTWQTGPTIPLLLWEPGAEHPVSVVPGAGLQLSFSMQQFQRAFLGHAWDMFDLNVMAFGSLVTADSGQQFGQLSGAVAACTMSSLICLGGGKHILNNSGAIAGKSGWFVVFALSVNFAASPESPPVGIAQGAAGLARGNTLFLGRE